MRGSEGAVMGKSAKPNDEIEQVYCLTADEGHVWIHVYDTLPASVRRRLRDSPFNVCAACLVAYVLPEVKSKHPNWSREKLLIAGIESMEVQVRNREDRT
jgi:hypothetical protein